MQPVAYALLKTGRQDRGDVVEPKLRSLFKIDEFGNSEAVQGTNTIDEEPKRTPFIKYQC